MPLNTNKKLRSSQISQIKKLSAALAIALAVPLGAQAASLGRLTVLSSLGQPLRAEIEVTAVSTEEAGKLSAKLASAEAFSRANVDYNPVLGSLSFAVEQRQGRHFIRISSSQPVSDPFVDLLLELSAGNSKLVREYTFLLDPADSKAPRNAQVAPLTPSAPSVKAEPAPANNAPPAASAAPAPATPAAPAAPAAAEQAAAPAPAPAAAPAPAPAPAPVAQAPAPVAPAPVPAATAVASGPIPVSGEEPATNITQRPAPSALAEELIRRQEASPANTPASASPNGAPAANAAGQSASGEVLRPAAPATVAATGGKAADYRVKQGDTLAGIAARNKQANVSLDQMLIALYRANPDAFMGKNINRLRAGSSLAVPDQPTAAAIDQGEAHGMVVAQAQDFNAYRNKLAGQVASAPARNQDGESRSGSGKITTRVEERGASAAARDRLELSRANRAKGNTGNAGAAEDKAASERALADANDRVKELEKNVGDLQKLLELKNKTIADLSTQQKEAEAAKAAAPAAAPEVAKPEEKPAAAAEAKPEEKPAESAAAPAPAPAAPAPATPAPATAPAATPAPAAKPAEKSQNFFESMTQNPYVLAGVGAVVALLVAGVGVVAVRRRKKKAEEAAAEKAAEPEPAPEAPAAAVIAEPAVEEPPAEEAPAEIVAAPAAAAAVAEEPVEETQVDPLAEADMYIAYGRDEQAEDILKLALQSQPERQALHSKLLEIYAKRGDVSSFNKVAADLHQLSGGLNEAWAKAADLGFELDPTNPLYGGAPPAPAAPEPAPEEPAMEFDLSDFKGAEIQPGAAPAEPAVDLGRDIDFDLDLENGAKPDDDEPILPAAAGASSASALLDDGDGQPAVSLSDLDLSLPEDAAPPSATNILDEDEESAFEAEMTTKLDLAAAYQEIGDKEGARELLDEVMRGGNDAQVARAKDMLATLA